MKKAGILGGLGPASTIDYYRDIIENYRKVFGEDNYPEIVIESVNMKDIVTLVEQQDYKKLADKLIAVISNLEKAGADFAAIASNTPHIAWQYIENRTNIPVISIIDALCSYIIKEKYKKVLIFGISFTMKNGLFSNAFEKAGINYVLPDSNDIETLGAIIYPNLENGIVIEEDKKKMIDIAEKYISEFGCDALLLGCTEIPLMIKPGDVSVPIINSTQVHIQKINEFIVS